MLHVTSHAKNTQIQNPLSVATEIVSAKKSNIVNYNYMGFKLTGIVNDSVGITAFLKEIAELNNEMQGISKIREI